MRGVMINARHQGVDRAPEQDRLAGDLGHRAAPQQPVECLLDIRDQRRVVHGVDPGNSNAEARRAELRIHQPLEILRAAALEEEQLLCHDLAILGNRVEGGLVLVQRLVNLLHDVDDRDGGPHLQVVVLQFFRVEAQLVEAVEQGWIVDSVLDPRLDEHLEGHRAPEPAVDHFRRDPKRIARGQVFQRIVGARDAGDPH
jgi:hypothetical protein